MVADFVEKSLFVFYIFVHFVNVRSFSLSKTKVHLNRTFVYIEIGLVDEADNESTSHTAKATLPLSLDQPLKIHVMKNDVSKNWPIYSWNNIEKNTRISEYMRTIRNRTRCVIFYNGIKLVASYLIIRKLVYKLEIRGELAEICIEWKIRISYVKLINVYPYTYEGFTLLFKSPPLSTSRRMNYLLFYYNAFTYKAPLIKALTMCFIVVELYV